MDHVARGEVLAGILVQRFVELADQLFEDRPHRGVVNLARVQIDGPEALQHLEQQPRLVELADGVVEVEPLQHLAHVSAEAGDVVAQVGREVRRIGEQGFEVVARGVVEGKTGRPAELRVQVIQPASAQLGLPAQHLPLCRGKHAVEPPEHGQGQDDVLVLAPFEAVTDQIRDTPEEADNLAVVHRMTCAGARGGSILDVTARNRRAGGPEARVRRVPACALVQFVIVPRNQLADLPLCAGSAGLVPSVGMFIPCPADIGGPASTCVEGAGATGPLAARAGY